MTNTNHGGGYIYPLAYAKSGYIRTPLPFHTEWNARVNACKSIEELEQLKTITS